MQTILFNEINMYLDFGLILRSKTIGTPTPKTQEVDIPGADGTLDLTEYLGKVTYNNVPLSFEFETVLRQDEFLKLFASIKNAIHGKKMKTVLSIDEEFYYFGRVYVNEWQSDKTIGKITIDVNAEPYRYRTNKTVQSVMIGEAGTLTVNLINLKKQVTPTITVSAETNIKFKTMSYSMSAGTASFYDFQLTEGENIFTFEAEPGTVITVEYQEGEL